MFSKLFPKNTDMFELFDQQMQCVVNTANYFRHMNLNGGINQEGLAKIRDFEHQADQAALKILEQLDKTFITPFDREDILGLVNEIDNVPDLLKAFTRRLVNYKITSPNENLLEFSKMIEESVTIVSRVVSGLRDSKNHKALKKACIEVNRLEQEGDTLRDKCLGELFEAENDPIVVIKWKDIYQDAETLLDICKDITDRVENILVKQV